MIRAIKESFLKTGWSLGLYTPPDRAMLDRVIAELAKHADCERMLFVGVKQYNAHLPALFRGTSARTFTTIDPTPEVARFGGTPHYVDMLENLNRHVAPASFDVVVMNGVIGFGMNEATNVERALEQVHRALRPEGLLLLGINEQIPTHVPLAPIAAMKKFAPATLGLFGGPRVVLDTPFRERTHTFELYARQ